MTAPDARSWRGVRNASRAELALAIALVGLGVLLLSGIRDIAAGIGYDRVGPRFFPYVVAAGLIALGGMLAVSAVIHPRVIDGAHAAIGSSTWVPVAYLAVGFALFLVLVERAGFVVASSLQFWLVTRAFGSRRPWRDALVASGLSAIVYIAFSKMLGLTLPGFPPG